MSPQPNKKSACKQKLSKGVSKDYQYGVQTVKILQFQSRRRKSYTQIDLFSMLTIFSFDNIHAERSFTILIFKLC